MKATLLGGAALSLLTVCRIWRRSRSATNRAAAAAAAPFTWTSCYARRPGRRRLGQKDLTDTAGVCRRIDRIYLRQPQHQRLPARRTNRMRLSVRIQLGARHRRRGGGRRLSAASTTVAQPGIARRHGHLQRDDGLPEQRDRACSDTHGIAGWFTSKAASALAGDKYNASTHFRDAVRFRGPGDPARLDRGRWR